MHIQVTNNILLVHSAFISTYISEVLPLVGEIYREESIECFSMLGHWRRAAHLEKSAAIHPFIHPLIHPSSIIFCFGWVFLAICPKYSVMPQIRLFWLFYIILLFKTADLWVTLVLLDIDYQHLKWKAITSITICHKGFSADHREIWINTTLLCHWQGWKRASVHIRFYKANNKKLLSLCFTGRVMRHRLNFSPGDETQWAGIWGKR